MSVFETAVFESVSRPQETGVPPEASFLLGRFRRAGRFGSAAPLEKYNPRVGRLILSLSTPSVTADFLLSRGNWASARTDDGTVTLLVHGEMHDVGPSGPAEWTLRSYLSRGGSFVRGLHGSFVLAIVDGRADALYVVTDPMNSRKVYWQRRGNYVWIATCHAFPFLPLEDVGPDELGLAHYVVNGIPLRGRTLFRGVRVLDRGAIHRLGRPGWDSERYWTYEFRATDAEPRKLRSELSDLLLTAVRRRVQDRPRVLLSLSGGYDSPTILGALHRLSVDDARCFSYAVREERDGGDAGLARRMCERLGYPHFVVPAYEDSLLTVLRDNVIRGNGLTRLVVETDAWRAVRSKLADSPETVLFVGDECLGWTDADLRSEADVLRVLGIRGWAGVDWLKQWMPVDVVHRWNRSIAEDLRNLISSVSGWDDLHDLKDVLYFEERLPRLLSWRETFAGGYGGVRYPLLDREILRFMQKVPVDLRRGKRLFREVARESFPRVFEQQRAEGTGWMVRRWAERVVREDAGQIRDLIQSEESLLDGYLPPASLLRLLRICGRPSWTRRLLPRTVRKTRRVLEGIGTSPPGDPALPPPPDSVLLVRALFLRCFFRKHLSTESRRADLPDRD